MLTQGKRKKQYDNIDVLLALRKVKVMSQKLSDKFYILSVSIFGKS